MHVASENDDRSRGKSVIPSPSAFGGCKLFSPLSMRGEPESLYAIQTQKASPHSNLRSVGQHAEGLEHTADVIRQSGHIPTS
jgi:hypothetical protein